WTFPLLISPHDHNTVYVTSQVVHRTTDGGQSWQVISPDLTTNDTTKMGISGGLTPDNIGVEYCCVIYAFDESPAQAGVLWAGSNDGLVHVSRDDGKSWTDVTRNIPDLPPLGIVRNIDASKYDAGKAYMTVDRHQMGDFEPYVYRTSDYGRHWTKITAGIPESPVRFARNVIEDPVRPGLLYLGTENTIYVSFDDGDHWQPLRTNLPPAPMYWLVVQPHFNDLVVASYGRGFWILDDVTPLQQLTAEVAASPAHLFAPRPAYRFQEITEPFAMSDDWSAGHNPPYGADINYWLKDGTDSVTIRIMDAAGDTVRTFKGSGHAGINRAWWNLRGEPSTQIRMRTKPLYADWVPFNDEGWRAAGGRVALLEPPGTYTVALEVGGHTFTRPLTVLKDPNSEGGAADIAKQLALLTDIRSDLDAAARMVNRIEWMRRQLQDLASLLKARGHDDVLAADTDLEQKLIAVESRLVQLKTTGYGQDGVRYPSMVVGRLGYLAGAVESADFPPTDQDRQVHDLLYQQLRAQHQALAELEGGAVAAFNRLLAQKGLSGVISQTQP
ncbi:MAG TPA: hypothetical protein VJ957_07840, partial [Longimicrobiales bacterium]|nr:hypothetical protein [Longimicrobiales bacterium]